METGCDISWNKSKEKAKSLGASLSKSAVIADVEVNAEMSDSKTEDYSMKGRQRYGTTYCSFMEVTKDTKSDDF